MITITDLKKKFGETTACDIPSLTINEGDILGLVGNNGAGKTTLFRMMLDLLKPDEGKVTVNGINPADSEDWKQHVSAYIDEGFLIDYLTPEEYFAFLAKISNLPQDVMNQRLQKYERLSGGEVFGQNKLIRNLSAGNKQKVGIISALIRETDIVILDEPFNFLDPTSQNILKRVLKQYAADTHATIIISSHNLQHTIDISTRIVLLEKGQIINDLSTMQSEAKQQLEDYFRDKE
jgi:ABC-2 type transport system ATP-binding protein